jgi:hypothetical protein
LKNYSVIFFRLKHPKKKLFRVKQPERILGLLDPEDEGNTVLQIFRAYSPSNTALHHKRLASSSAVL